jgi:hypothetical protein
MISTVKFKEGDRIKMKVTCSHCFEGDIYTLGKDRNSSCLKVDNGSIGSGCTCQEKWELIVPSWKEKITRVKL